MFNILVPALFGVVGYAIGSGSKKDCTAPVWNGASKDLVPDGSLPGIPKGAPGVPTSANCDVLIQQAVSALPLEQKNAILSVWNAGNPLMLTSLANSMETSSNPALQPVIACLRQKAATGKVGGF
jgi:hypothetical protein